VGRGERPFISRSVRSSTCSFRRSTATKRREREEGRRQLEQAIGGTDGKDPADDKKANKKSGK
jgi:hypothetical protein